MTTNIQGFQKDHIFAVCGLNLTHVETLSFKLLLCFEKEEG